MSKPIYTPFIIYYNEQTRMWHARDDVGDVLARPSMQELIYELSRTTSWPQLQFEYNGAYNKKLFTRLS